MTNDDTTNALMIDKMIMLLDGSRCPAALRPPDLLYKNWSSKLGGVVYRAPGTCGGLYGGLPKANGNCGGWPNGVIG